MANAKITVIAQRTDHTPETRRLIDELEEIVYVSDPVTYDLLYVNRSGLKVMKTRYYKGMKCYEAFHGSASPCSFCTNPLLRYDKFYLWEFANPYLGRYFLIKDKLIVWQGKPARMELAIDISEKENISRKAALELKTARTLIECIRALSAEGELEEVIHAVLAETRDFYDGDRAYIFEINPDGETFSNTYEVCRDGVAPQKNTLQNIPIQDVPFWTQMFLKDGCFTLEDVESLREAAPAEYRLLRRQEIRSLIAAALSVDRETLGYIGVDNPRELAEADLLRSLSYFVITEISKRRLKATFEYMSYHDALTGLSNRCKYMEDIRRLNAGRPRCLGVVYIDINGMKQLNDRYGHERGDQAIIKTAQILRRFFAGHSVYRLGGDEFIILCENMGRTRFLQQTVQMNAYFRSCIDVSVSVGHVWQEGVIDVAKLTLCADERMYRNKQIYYDSGNSRPSRRAGKPGFRRSVRCDQKYRRQAPFIYPKKEDATNENLSNRGDRRRRHRPRSLARRHQGLAPKRRPIRSI